MGRRDHADVDLADAAAADRADLALLQHAQQARLHARAACRRSRRGTACRRRPRRTRPARSVVAPVNAPRDVTEQLAVDQRLGDRAAVERDEPLPCGAAALVERARDQLLAGAALALDQDRDVLLGEPIERVAQPAHRRATAPISIESLGDVCASAAELAAQPRIARRRLHHRRQLERLERLGQVVERAGAHARGGGVRGLSRRSA